MTRISSPNLHNLIKRIGKNDFHGVVTAYDPGETTGFAAIERGPDHTTLIAAEQISTWPLEVGVPNLRANFTLHKPTQVIYESYHVYDWKLDQHSFSEIPTVQIIGALKVFLIERSIPYYRQTAMIGKGFSTDDRLQQWGLHIAGRHSRDAIRHACQFLLFGQPKE